jgi:hypothetical protein
VLYTAKAKLHSMSIFLAKSAMEVWFGSMSSKEMRSALAIRITLGNTRRNNKLRSSYGRAIQSISTLTTIQRLALKRRSQLRLRRSKFRSINIGVTRKARIQTLGTKTLAPCAQNLILILEALTSTTCHLAKHATSLQSLRTKTHKKKKKNTLDYRTCHKIKIKISL